MSISPLTFTGVSTFSEDFQTIIDRAVSIAKLPVTLLENKQTDIIQEKMLAGNLSSAVGELATAVKALGTLGENQGIAATSSNSTKVSVASTTGDSPAVYTISDITSIATAASERSVTGYATGNTAVSTDGHLQLVVGSHTYNITLAEGKNNLAGLRDAINALGAGVTASVLTTGTGDTPNYLSVTANSVGATTLTLTDVPADTSVAFLSATNQGDELTPASETSLTGFATTDSTEVSADSHMSLVFGTQTYDFTLDTGKNNLDGLVEKINGLGAGVTASITVGGDSQYHLTVTADNPGATTLSLSDIQSGPTTALLTTANQGANTVFKLNGVQVTKSSTLINDVVPGVSFNILDTTDSGETVTLTLSQDRTKLSSALQNLATKYNAVRDQVNAQIGESAGLLSGSNLIRATQDAMRSLMQAQGSGTIRNLTALGIEFSKSGEMSFNESSTDANAVSFDKLTSSQIADAFDFLGSTTSGLGVLYKRFTDISDPVSGMVKSQTDQWDKTDDRITEQIDTLTDRINLMQTTLKTKLQQADTLLATLESQQNTLTATLTSLKYVNYGKEAE